MNDQQKAAYENCFAALIELPWQQRAEVFANLRYNDTFCTACGYGERGNPHPNCQCENDA
jgi:hypothetical protein